MTTEPTSVNYLKKIDLLLEAGVSEKEMNLTKGKPQGLSFIYGVGSEGITFFEKALFNKMPGDEVVIKVPSNQTEDFFGHLKQPIQDIFPEQPMPFFLKARVAAVDTPSERDIIRAMAQGVASDGCGCGCSCGCGC